jgi:hypothetical protein
MDLFWMFHRLWLFWSGLFPENSLFGSKQQTAVVVLIVVVPAIGWLLRELFGRDSSVR